MRREGGEREEGEVRGKRVGGEWKERVGEWDERGR